MDSVRSMETVDLHRNPGIDGIHLYHLKPPDDNAFFLFETTFDALRVLLAMVPLVLDNSSGS